jgi:hypothetical protein
VIFSLNCTLINEREQTKNEKDDEKMKLNLVNYFDVWGNKKDGYEVNNLCSEGEVQVKSWEDGDILKALKEKDFLKKHVRKNMLNFVDCFDEIVEIEHKKTGRPICRLELIR